MWQTLVQIFLLKLIVIVVRIVIIIVVIVIVFWLILIIIVAILIHVPVIHEWGEDLRHRFDQMRHDLFGLRTKNILDLFHIK